MVAKGEASLWMRDKAVFIHSGMGLVELEKCCISSQQLRDGWYFSLK